MSQPSKVMFTVLRLTNPNVNLKRMHQLYKIELTAKTEWKYQLLGKYTLLNLQFSPRKHLVIYSVYIKEDRKMH